ncbi:MAG: DUF354 domain-containing protein [Candidatus Omnitrophica bacterium]|nr:DUF354 domain-containing protein [Candidatus Omnitrophota bacterium]MDD5352659.1 DUF354 domain-containing protein [Candidatus Omnitrophota bacterium]MDD5550258.1 DUF354 domain-containing protein [Candidatus Omnitrophota bacterium]
MKKVILFRVDGGKVWGISTGHIRRSLILANVLSSKYKIIFVMKNYPDGVDFVKNRGINVELIDINDDSDASLINLCAKYSPEKIIFDLYSNPYTDLLEYAHARQIQTIVFDILGKCAGCPDILINDSFVGDFTKYPHLINKTRLYLGTKYFIIAKPIKIIPIRHKVKDVMITMGGSDPAGLTLKIMRSVLKDSMDFTAHIILGPSFTGHKEVYDIVKSRRNIKVHKNPLNFLKLLSLQDVVITAAGRTLYECAYLGKPVIIVPSIDHEIVVSAEYAKLTGSFYVGHWDDVISPAKIIKALDYYKNNYSKREPIFKSSRNLVDGSGLKRILAIIN